MISTLSAWIYLPEPFVYQLLADLEFDFDLPMMPPSIPCEKRAYLPDLTFGVGGQNLTVSSFDYTLAWPVDDDHGARCVSAILPILQDPQDPEPLTEISLGSAFLREFYTVFDLDEMRIGCKGLVLLITYALTDNFQLRRKRSLATLSINHYVGHSRARCTGLSSFVKGHRIQRH